MPKRTCGVLAFGLKATANGNPIHGQTSLAAIVTHVADARTCVLHPASHTTSTE
jgi:O-acetylhomoserine (thiol)-lyase